MERDVIDIITEKEFYQLTQDELTQVSELCSSEEEFLHMKQVFNQMSGFTEQTVTPKAETKESLDALFAQTYPRATPVWYSSILAAVVPKEKPIYRQPLMQLAAVALLLLLVVPLFNQELVLPEPKIAQLEMPLKSLEDIQSESSIEKEEVVMDSLDENESIPVIDGLKRDLNEEFMDEFDAVNTQQPTSAVIASNQGAIRATSAESPSPASNHPDGVFMGGDEVTISYSISAMESSDLLDLLTTTF